MKLRFVTFLMALSASVTALAFDAKKCAADLTEGRNNFRVKLNSVAVNNLFGYYLKNKSRIGNKDYTVLIDYSLSSKEKRAFLIDMGRCEIIANEVTIHGGHYSKESFTEGDPDHDGMLDRCVRKNGSRKYMTRPGYYLTNGCHRTQLKGWTVLFGQDCQGIDLVGQNKGINSKDVAVGVVMHEHIAVRDDQSIKPVGQGCPTFAPGQLKAMVRYGVHQQTLVYLYVPQCKGP